ncbi:MAG: hypothetical protein OES46_04205 [Gammaproteobacteria bacterium]|nr:hypothetical protein [Gammaproteobacteria bacterium]
MNTYRILLIALVARLAHGCATDLLTSRRVVVKDDMPVIDVSFNDHDRRLIHQYYRHHKKHKGKKMPAGLAKRGGNFPPGLAKRDTLPPGLEGRALPADLEAQLTPLPNSYVRVRVGDLVLLGRNTRIVFDIIYGVAS